MLSVLDDKNLLSNQIANIYFALMILLTNHSFYVVVTTNLSDLVKYWHVIKIIKTSHLNDY
jgi:heme/copper-type cytochrome/quinol oxidase subunit 4